jgi:prepilin-type N-terminal cleavage/methylation domain-containing protein
MIGLLQTNREQKPFKSRNGFTLLEILISVVILALIALMMTRIFSDSTRAVELGKNQTVLDETARRLLDMIEQNVSQALIRENVAFQVHPIMGNDALYFISTGIQQHSELFSRETSPMRLQAGHIDPTAEPQATNWNKIVSISSPYDSTGSQADNFRNLILQSDYYQLNAVRSLPDFKPVNSAAATMTTRDYDYTYPAIPDMGDHAVLTFLDITVNADENRSFSPAEDGSAYPPGKNKIPTFLDVSIGLTTSADMRLAMQMNKAGKSKRGIRQIEKNEQVYTRRIFMRNTGIQALNF